MFYNIEPQIYWKRTCLQGLLRRGCDRMVVGFTTTYAIKFVSDLR